MIIFGNSGTYSNASSGSVSITFPCSFSHDNYTVVLTSDQNANAIGNGNVGLRKDAKSVSTLEMVWSALSQIRIQYIVIGY